MMLTADGGRVGVVSGGCLEADVARRAWFLRAAGEAERVRYDTGSGDDATYEFGLGCRGIVDVLLERLDVARDPPIVFALREAVERRRTTSFATSLAAGKLGHRRVSERPDVGGDEFAERIAPPTQLIVFGSGVDVPPVVRIAAAIGWQTLVVDGRLRNATAVEPARAVPRSPGAWQGETTIDATTAAVVMTHRMDDDAGYLRDALASDSAYVGCLGPASRTEALLDQLAIDGVVVSERQRSLLRGPIGLDLGAESPEQIALAIVSEIQAALAGADGRPLSGRIGPIHRPREPSPALAS